jgi:hypothetical protein
MRRDLAILVLALPLLSAPRPAHAAWPHDPKVNLPVTSTGSSGQYLFGFGRNESVSDGQGGIICVWDDFASFDNLRAQRIDATGNRLWGDAGILVQTGSAIQQIAFSAIPDGSGGAVLAWQDPRNGTQDVYAQRLDSNGNLLWGTNGVAVCAASGDQTDVRLASDGSGGAWITWTDARAGVSDTDIYARRVNGAGVPQGVANGIGVCVVTGNQNSARIASLVGLSGCTIIWKDARIDGGDLLGQRLDFAGNPAWAPNGLPICTATGAQQSPAVVNDGGSGIVAVWADGRAGMDIYAQRLNSGGSAIWTLNGVAVCAAANAQAEPALAQDGAGGVVVVFSDYRNLSQDIYAQRISIETGATVWFGDGQQVCAELGAQRAPLVVADGTGGAYVAWYDERQNDLGDIYAQHLSSFGYSQWSVSGVAVAVSPNWEYGHSLVSAGVDGCLVQMVHEGGGSVARVAAQKIDRWGYLGAEPTIAAVTDVPNDQGGKVKVSWLASPLDTDPLFGAITDYLVFRSVPTAAVQAALARGLVTDSAAEATGASLDGSVRLLRVVDATGTTSFWESIAQLNAAHLDSYSAVVATTGDSIPGSNPPTEFMVQARQVGVGWWNSASLAGYSVDDLFPAMPAPFAGSYASGTAHLAWGANAEPDLAHYRLYRGGLGFVPSPANLVAEPTGITFTDVAGAPFEYQLTAVDIHGNESLPARVVPDGTVAVGDGPAAIDFLAPPSPQPMRATAGARLRFGLARAGRANLALYDVQGRRVSVLVDADLEAGEHSARLAGGTSGGAPAPGLYIVRFTAPGFRATRRLIVTR